MPLVAIPAARRFPDFAIPWACCHSHTAQSTAWLKKFCGNGYAETRDTRLKAVLCLIRLLFDQQAAHLTTTPGAHEHRLLQPREKQEYEVNVLGWEPH